MTYHSIVISSGHGKHVPGAIDILDEHKEAVRVVNRLAEELTALDIDVITFEDTVSTTQDENLNRIVDFHNSKTRDLDISVHFNAYTHTDEPRGTEVLYLTQDALAGQLASAIADCGFINRGGKKRDDLFFLNNTAAPAVLLEICFVDSSADVDIYRIQFGQICGAIADLLAGENEITPEPPVVGMHVIGKCSFFGGPDDAGVAPDEGLAIIDHIDDAPQLFLPFQPEGTTGLARRLNPYVHYIACRWDYNQVSKATLLGAMALVRSTRTGIALRAFPADWGPNQNTGRVADLSPGLMEDLGLTTDDEVEVIFPYPAEELVA